MSQNKTKGPQDNMLALAEAYYNSYEPPVQMSGGSGAGALKSAQTRAKRYNDPSQRQSSKKS